MKGASKQARRLLLVLLVLEQVDDELQDGHQQHKEEHVELELLLYDQHE